jgi:predicted flap endonuclease-1-like 5' DNA nuclease
MARVKSAETKATDIAEGLAAAATEPFASLESVDGIGPAYAKRLMKAGVMSTAALVERTSDSDGINRLAEQTGLPASSIESWSKDADLTRIKGVGSEYMGLLNAARIGSVSQLAEAKADELRSEIVSVHSATGMAETLPSQQTIREWITAAKRLS